MATVAQKNSLTIQRIFKIGEICHKSTGVTDVTWNVIRNK